MDIYLGIQVKCIYMVENESKSKEEGRDQESIQSSTTLDRDQGCKEQTRRYNKDKISTALERPVKYHWRA